MSDKDEGLEKMKDYSLHVRRQSDQISDLKKIIYKSYQLLKAERDDEAYMLLELAVKEND